ncbi:MAG: 4-phosphoerythronate dehydrogenase PdxB [Lentisphaerae bacterium]|nr:4-phosphoerythronate dehydrogenase PdxB [Lentisphaerota bacterium]
MKVIADDKIPFLKGVLESAGVSVEYIPGAETTAETVRNADALITRTRTKCNQALLAGSQVRFIATATIGFDHIDTEYVEKQNIVWTNAPGCNSGSVAQYMASLLLNLAVQKSFALSDKVLGVVGVGHVGKKVAAVGEALGMKVLLNDPPRARAEGKKGFVELDEIIEQADIITLHVPLEYNSSDPTYHLADAALIGRLRPTQYLINASRGEVVDNVALREALKGGKLAGGALDVWENEPAIDLELMELLDFATPHIAGYSTDGKANGTGMSVNALAKFFQLPGGLDKWYPGNVPLPEVTSLTVMENGSQEEKLAQVVNASYNIIRDTEALRNAPDKFEKLRGTYPLRREFHNFTVKCSDVKLAGILQKLGFNLEK